MDAALADGRYPDVIVFVGPTAHDQAHRRRIAYGRGSALALADGQSPEDFTWPPVEPVAIVSDEPDPIRRAAIINRTYAICTRTTAGAR